MGNISENIKKILANKNTVTVIMIVLIIIVLYFAYNYRVNQATKPISVPYADSLISPGVEITEDMIGITEITNSMLHKLGAVSNPNEVVGMWSNPDSVIPAGSLFFERSLIKKDQISNNDIDYPAGWVPYHLDDISVDTTYGNAMYPGNYIDIYIKIVEKKTKKNEEQSDFIKVSKLFKNVKILSVKDSSGNDVFADLDEIKTPSMMIFALTKEDYILLKKCENLTGLDATIIPVPTAESLEEKPGNLEVVDKKLVKYINDNTLVRD